MHPIQPVRSIRATVVIVLSTILAMSISACSSESELTEIAGEYSYTGAPIPISISAAGIETFGSRPVTRSGAMKDTNVDPLDDDYNFVSSIESEAEQPQPLTRTALGDGIYFRVLAYKNNAVSTENFAGAADYKIDVNKGKVALASPDNPLALKPGKYTFICYSYNKTEPIVDDFDGKNGTSIEVSHGMDFLSAKQVATVQADANGTYTLPGFTFSHMCARVYLEMSSTQGEITQCSARLSNLNSTPVQWQVGDAEITNSGKGGSADLSWSSLNAATVTSEPMYILPNNARNVTVSLTFIAGGTKYTNKTFDLLGRAFSCATSYKITAKQKGNSISIEGLKFKVAIGNVIKKGTKWQMQATQGDFTHQWGGGDYFNWGATNPTDVSVRNDTFTDVCKNLGGQWRTPDQSEIKQFTTCDYIWGAYSGTDRGEVYGYYFGTTSVPSSDKKDSYVFLPAAGYRRDGDTTMCTDVNTYGYYWSRTDYGTGARYLYFKSSTIYLSNIYRTWGMSVRCIADK